MASGRSILLALLGTLLHVVLVSTAIAQSSNRGKVERTAKTAKEERAVALAFAEKHHPELAELLAQLEARNKREFTQAVRQLVMVRDRLERTRARDVPRYEVQLALWKLDSRIQLLAARLTMGDDEELREDLRALVRRRLAARLDLLELQRKQYTDQLANVEKSIDRIQADPEALAEKETSRILSELERRRPSRKDTVETKTTTRKSSSKKSPK